VVGGTSQISQTPGRAECCRGNGSPGLIAQRAEPVVRGALRGKGGEPARSRACALRVVSRRASALAMPGGVASNMPTSPSSRPVWAEPFGRAGIEAAEVEAERAIAGGHGAAIGTEPKSSPAGKAPLCDGPGSRGHFEGQNGVSGRQPESGSARVSWCLRSWRSVWCRPWTCWWFMACKKSAGRARLAPPGQPYDSNNLKT